MTAYPRIQLPAPNDPAWDRAKEIVTALRARGEQNPFVVAALGNGYAESRWTAIAAGDNRKSFGPWQINEVYGAQPIQRGTGIDIRTELSLAKHVDALLWLIASKPYVHVAAAIDAAKTGEEATRAFTVDFERPSAPGAADRRAALAGPIEVWLAHLT